MLTKTNHQMDTVMKNNTDRGLNVKTGVKAGKTFTDVIITS